MSPVPWQQQCPRQRIGPGIYLDLVMTFRRGDGCARAAEDSDGFEVVFVRGECDERVAAGMAKRMGGGHSWVFAEHGTRAKAIAYAFRVAEDTVRDFTLPGSGSPVPRP